MASRIGCGGFIGTGLVGKRLLAHYALGLGSSATGDVEDVASPEGGRSGSRRSQYGLLVGSRGACDEVVGGGQNTGITRSVASTGTEGASQDDVEWRRRDRELPSSG
jgi:hypothetical protein